jgi:hypothetical protein
MIYFEVNMDEFGKMTMEEMAEHLRDVFSNVPPESMCFLNAWHEDYTKRMRNTTTYKILKFSKRIGLFPITKSIFQIYFKLDDYIFQPFKRFLPYWIMGSVIMAYIYMVIFFIF